MLVETPFFKTKQNIRDSKSLAQLKLELELEHAASVPT
jgi:hypothetical protein